MDREIEYIDENPRRFDVEAALYVVGDFDPAGITEMTGIRATRTWRAGERQSPRGARHPNSGWKVMAEIVPDADVHEHIERLLRQLDVGWDALRELTAMHTTWLSIYINVYGTDIPETLLTSEVIGKWQSSTWKLPSAPSCSILTTGTGLRHGRYELSTHRGVVRLGQTPRDRGADEDGECTEKRCHSGAFLCCAEEVTEDSAVVAECEMMPGMALAIGDIETQGRNLPIMDEQTSGLERE